MPDVSCVTGAYLGLGGRRISTFTRSRRESASDYVVQAVQKAIRAGELKIGDQLPSETVLMEQLGVGRSSIREGIKCLVTFGLLEIRPGQGTFVTDKFVKNVFNVLGFTVVGENINYLNQVRNMLEIGCIKLVYDKFTAEQCDELEALSRRLVDGRDVDGNVEADSQFHIMLIEASDNPLIINIYNTVKDLVHSLMNELMSHDNIVADARKAHLHIVEALREKSLEKCMKAMEDHLDTVEDYTKKYMH